MQEIIASNKDGGGPRRKSSIGSGKDILANYMTLRGSDRSSQQSMGCDRAYSGPIANLSELIGILPGSSLNPQLGTRISEENTRSPSRFAAHKHSIDESPIRFAAHKHSIDDCEYSKDENIEKLSLDEPNTSAVRDQARL